MKKELESEVKENMKMTSIAEKAIKIIQSKYDEPEYRSRIQAIADHEQRLYDEIDKIHTSAVLDWVKKLWSSTPEALMIAAAGHDWDRAFGEERDKLEYYPAKEGKPLPEWYDVHKAMHSANTARILRRELSDIVPQEIMLDVVYLVLNHEVGGKKQADGALLYLPDNATQSYNLNEAANTLQQADSLAFFNVLDIYVNWRKPQKVEQKIRYMYERIQDQKIKQLIRELKFNDSRAVEIFNRVVS